MTMYGANADELDRVARAMSDAADELENDTGFLSRILQSVPWVGAVAKNFISMWESNHARRLNQSVQFLRLTADGLTQNAAQQREASNDTGMSASGHNGHRSESGAGSGAQAGTGTADRRFSPEAAHLAAVMEQAYERGGPFRNQAVASVLQKGINSMGSDVATGAVAALAATPGGAEILRAAARGAATHPLLNSFKIGEVLTAGRELAQSAVAARPPTAVWQGVGEVFQPSVVDFVRVWQQALAFIVPWSNPFVFDQCYSVAWSDVSVRFGR